MTRRVTSTLIAAAVSGLVAAAQQQTAPEAPPADRPQVTFRVEVNYVEIDAAVTDAQGRVVTDLTKDDFQVFEDGKRQDVTSFARVDIPIERAERPLFASAPIEADVQTNEHVEGRIYLILLDDLHTDATRTARVKAAARRFIEHSFGTNDLAAVVFTGRSSLGQDFTNNKRLLVAAIDKFTGHKLRSETLNRIDTATVNQNTQELEPGQDFEQMDRAFRARSLAYSVKKLAEFMAGVHGRRKAMLLIGEGVDYDIYAIGGQAGGSASSVLLDTQDAIAAATRGNVSIYTIDPRGLANAEDELIEVPGGIGDADAQATRDAFRLSQDSLRVFATNTGGFASLNRNDFDTAFDRIVSENSSYYVLGYYPMNDRRDGRFRKIQVRTRAGLRVRSRSGYYEARGRAPSQPIPSTSSTALPPAVAEALGSPIPVAGLPLQVFAAPYKGEDLRASVALVFEMDVNNLSFVEKDGSIDDKIDVGYSAVDSNNKVFPGDRHTLTLTLKPDTFQRMKERGLRVLSQATLPPGRYQLRFAAGDRSGKAGSVVYDLDVPDFSKEPLTMSGVALTSTSSGQTVTIKPKNPLGDFLPGPPTTVRAFDRTDELALFAEFYENAGGAGDHKLAFKAELRADGGRVVQEVSDERSSTELHGANGGYGFAPRLNLDSVDPGLYVIHVEGRSRANPEAVVSRDIQIRVR